MSHKYTPVLRELVSLLAPCGDVYLHVDAKSDITPFSALRDEVVFVEPRVNVAWGCWTQIEANLRLLESTRAGEYGHIAIISGDTLPVRPPAEIAEWLAANAGREFVFERPLKPAHADRLKYRHPQVSPRDMKPVARVLLTIQRRLRLLPRNRGFERIPRLVFASNWIVITPEFRDWMQGYLSDNPWFADVFRHSHCGDELFFGTLLASSPFADAHDRRRYMYVDWETGPDYPRTLTAEDYGRMSAAAARDTAGEHYLFARKMADNTDIAHYRRTFIDRAAGND